MTGSAAHDLRQPAVKLPTGHTPEAGKSQPITSSAAVVYWVDRSNGRFSGRAMSLVRQLLATGLRPKLIYADNDHGNGERPQLMAALRALVYSDIPVLVIPAHTFRRMTAEQQHWTSHVVTKQNRQLKTLPDAPLVLRRISSDEKSHRPPAKVAA